jgi:hypothetical protein
VNYLMMKGRTCWWSESSVDVVKGLLMKWTLTQSTWRCKCAYACRTVRIAVQCSSRTLFDVASSVSRALFSVGELLVFSLNISRLSRVISATLRCLNCVSNDR